MTKKTDEIQRLNDEFRTGIIEHPERVHASHDVRALDAKTRAKVLRKVQTYTDFTPDNDPHKEHDFGEFVVAGERYYWKIDYYDKLLEGHSPNAADPSVTTRILTVMRAEEY